MFPPGTHPPLYTPHLNTHHRPHRAVHRNTLSAQTNTNNTHSLIHSPALTHALAHPLPFQLLPSWTHGPPSPGPTPGAALSAPDTHMHACTCERPPQTGRELAMKFNERTGQTVLTRCGAWLTKRTDQPASSQPFLYPYPDVFPHLVLPRSRSIPFPASASSFKHPVRSPVQSQNTPGQ